MIGSYLDYWNRAERQLERIKYKYLTVDQRWNERDYEQKILNSERKASWELRMKYIKELIDG